MSDIRLHYIEKGEGRPLVLLHGNGESCDYFGHQIDCFSKDYHVIALDTRGHGQSPRGEKPFTLRQFAEDLLDFMDEKGIDKATGKVLVEVDSKYFRPAEVDQLLGDPTKAKNVLGWNPQKTSFEDLVRIMVEHDMQHIKKIYHLK